IDSIDILDLLDLKKGCSWESNLGYPHSKLISSPLDHHTRRFARLTFYNILLIEYFVMHAMPAGIYCRD
uniref:Uncharacterized protein n=1 Tax=Romanomermis culicivorax TaxID=13658 RepID=A0A915KY74_ROMCU